MVVFVDSHQITHLQKVDADWAWDTCSTLLGGGHPDHVFNSLALVTAETLRTRGNPLLPPAEINALNTSIAVGPLCNSEA